jgi:signal transduction histidine kinase
VSAAQAWFLVAVVGSAAASAVIGVMALRRARSLESGRWLGVMALGQATWSGLYAGEVIAGSLAGKIAWDKLEWLGALFAIIGGWAFGLGFAGGRARALRVAGRVNLVLAVGFLVLVATDRWHGLGYRDCRMTAQPFPALRYDFGPSLLGGVLWMYVLATWAMIALVRCYRATHPIYRRQIVWVLLGMSVPYAGGFFTLAGVSWDISPFTFVACDVILAFALLRHRFLETAPIARELVFEHITDGVVVADPEGTVVDLNPAAERLLGDGAVGLALDALADKLGVGLPAVNGEAAWELARDGEVRYLQVTITPIPVGRGRVAGRLLLVRDQTAVRQAHAEVERAVADLARLNRDLERANRELETFNDSVSHELQAPLRHIRSFAAALIDEAGAELTPSAGKLLSRIHNASERMSALIAGMLRLVQVARQAMRPEPLALAKQVRILAQQRQASEPDQPRELRIAEPLSAIGDHALIQIVFQQLLDNAFKFTRDTGSPAVIEVGRAVTERGPAFYVRDSGVGFDMRNADQLFKPFRRMHPDNEHSGSGLGLALVKQIVERHGGEVWATSTPGAGTTIYFTLAPSAWPGH